MSRSWIKITLWLVLFAGLGLFVANEIARKNRLERGIHRYRAGEAHPGLNLVQIRQERKAVLLDNLGNIEHTWELPQSPNQDGWHAVEVSRDRGLLAILEDKSLTKLDVNSSMEWTLEDGFHHDVFESSSGKVYSLVRRPELASYRDEELPILREYLVEISNYGALLSECDLHALLESFIPKERWDAARSFHRDNRDFEPIEGSLLDLLHLNALKPIDLTLFGQEGLGWLSSSKHLHLIFVVDRSCQRLIWHWGAGTLIHPHDPVPTTLGAILIFDNGHSETRPYSRVVEVNPKNNEVTWILEKVEGESFFSPSKSSVQELPNGAILVGSAHERRAFEITRSGRVLWEYRSPIEVPPGDKRTFTKVRRIGWNN